MSNYLCQVRVYREHQWGAQPCSKTAIGALRNGTPACGIHLAAEKRRDATLEAAREKEKARAAALARVRVLHEKTGLNLRVGGADSALVPLDELERYVEAHRNSTLTRDQWIDDVLVSIKWADPPTYAQLGLLDDLKTLLKMACDKGAGAQGAW